MALTKRDTEHILQKLRGGTVPERGLETFAVRVERPRGELHRLLELVRQGEGETKFLRGGYGCGKTFLSRLAIADAHARGFATSFVVVSDNDLHFHRFDDVYRKVVSELSTDICPRGALGELLDRWVARVEDKLISAGHDPDGTGFDEKVQKELEAELLARTGNKVPQDFTRAIRTIFRLKQEGKLDDASALLSWLAGSENVASSSKKLASLKGEIGSTDAMEYLRGVLEIVKGAGYQGWVIVIDEAETILRMKSDVRGKSLNGIRQIVDAAGSFHGLLWIFTGTPDFFELPRGVKGLPPLYDRIQFRVEGNVATLKQPQLELRPFSADDLKEVALKLRDLYPAKDRARFERKITPEYIESLVAEVTQGFRGDVGVVPRQFLRRLVSVMDAVDEDETFEPSPGKPVIEPGLTWDEERKKAGLGSFDPEPGDDQGYSDVSF